jgi:hypothetical protein
MARITFKAKPVKVWEAEGDKLAFHSVQVPQFQRKHCDMDGFRSHRKYGGFANSDLFPAMLARIRRDIFGGRDWFKLESPPEGVTVQPGSLLYSFTVEV